MTKLEYYQKVADSKVKAMAITKNWKLRTALSRQLKNLTKRIKSVREIV